MVSHVHREHACIGYNQNADHLLQLTMLDIDSVWAETIYTRAYVSGQPDGQTKENLVWLLTSFRICTC